MRDGQRTLRLIERRQVGLAGGVLLLLPIGFVASEPALYDLTFPLIALLVLPFLRLPLHLGLAFLCLGIFLLASAISSFLSQGAEKAIGQFLVRIYLMSSWVFFVAILVTYSEQGTVALFNGYVVACMAGLPYAYGYYFGFIPSIWGMEIIPGRMFGTFKDPNVFGGFIIPAFLYAVMKCRSGLKWTWCLGVLCFGLSIFLSFSRGAWLATAAGIVVMMILDRRQGVKMRIPVPILIGVPVFMIFCGLLVSEELRVLFDQRFALLQGYDFDRFGTQRDIVLRAGEAPWGLGLGQIETIFTRSSHNVYLRVLAESGVIGAIAFLGFLALSVWRACLHARGDKSETGLPCVVGASLVSYLVDSLVIDTIHWRHFWFLLALPWLPLPVVCRGRDSVELGKGNSAEFGAKSS